MTYTPENCAKLAQRVVDGMDLTDLIRTMTDQIEENYLQDEEQFRDDWEIYCDD